MTVRAMSALGSGGADGVRSCLNRLGNTDKGDGSHWGWAEDGVAEAWRSNITVNIYSFVGYVVFLSRSCRVETDIFSVDRAF